MASIEEFCRYIHTDTSDLTAHLCLRAARAKARAAGVPDFKHNAQYDLFLYALAGYWYDNRSLMDIGGFSEDTQRMINTFVQELRYAEGGVDDGGE